MNYTDETIVTVKNLTNGIEYQLSYGQFKLRRNNDDNVQVVALYNTDEEKKAYQNAVKQSTDNDTTVVEKKKIKASTENEDADEIAEQLKSIK